MLKINPCDHGCQDGKSLERDAVDCTPSGEILPALLTRVAPATTPGEIVRCFTCRGHRVVSGSTSSGYKTAENAERAIASRTAVACPFCKTGWKRRIETLRTCFTCSGTGVQPVWSGGDILPEWVGRTDNMSRASSAAFAADVKIVVDRGHQLTWGESFLGLGSLWTTTDYGRGWESTDEAVIAGVRERLLTDRTQWCKVIDRDSRVIADTLVIGLSLNGYAVRAADVKQSRLMLPPTYTDTAMSRAV